MMTHRTGNLLFTRMAPHKRFLAWQECHKLVLAVYKATESFPKHELYGLTSQLRRAAFSAAANIVEGASRKGRNEFRHFLDISLGSLAEVEYGLEVALALDYLSPMVYAAMESQYRRAQFLTWKLKISLK
jgi:four helix bundle protein